MIRDTAALEKVLLVLDEFREGLISAEVLQQLLLSTAAGLTSYEDRQLRGRFEDAEGRIELIRFTVEEPHIRDEALKIVSAVEADVKRALSRESS